VGAQPPWGRGVSTVDAVAVEDVIEAVQEALVAAEARGVPTRWDLLEREAVAHDAATAYVARRARTAIEAGHTPMDVADEHDVVRQALAAYFHAGKFQSLLELDGVTDIMVNGADHVWVQYVDGRTARVDQALFRDDEDVRTEVAHLARRSGGTERRFDDGKPLLVLRLPDGSRLAAIMNVSPVPQVTIRRNVLPDVDLAELVAKGSIDGAMASLLAAAMHARMRLVVSGETGAGKTTLVRAMTNELPADTRIVVIEDTRELGLGADPRRSGSVLEWETREANIEGVGEITQRELVRHALRFNPDWLIVGEVRDGDAAREMLLAMQHGHPSLSTVHHHSALSAWKKLAQYVAQGREAVEFSIAALLISDAVDLFVHLDRDRQGRRVVAELCEVAGWNGAEVQLNRVFVPGPDGRGRPQPHLSDARRRRLVDHGFDDQLLLNPDGWWT
jgi:pilus assembly protein CpaF